MQVNSNEAERQAGGREETDEEAAKRRKFLGEEEEKVSESSEGHREGAEKASGSSEGHHRGAEKVSGSNEGIAEDDVPHVLNGNGVDEEQDAGDVRKMKKMIDPKMPSKEEVEAHEMVHLPK